MKHLKTKVNYGLELTKVNLDEVYLRYPGDKDKPYSSTPRFETLMEQEIEHPILVKGKKLYNGGLRVRVARAKGYTHMDAVVSDDITLLDNLTKIQRKDASKFFPFEQLEDLERYG